jgi:pimeloyl-ACP methyl ester carboxylesterase
MRRRVRGPIVHTITVKAAALPGGLSLPYAESGDPAGTPVVFVHAYVESWRYFEVVLRHLPASLHGYAPTQRGHGDADRPRDGYRPEDTAADIVGFMDALGIRRTVLVGSSSGGMVSQIVAGTHPDRVSALILISTPATLADKPGVTAMWEEVSVLEDPIDRDFVEEFVRGTSPESVPDEFVDVLVAESLKVPARIWQQTLRGLIDLDPAPNLDRITAPTLLISGDDDAFVSGDQDVLRRGIPDARHLVYKGAGHGIHLAQPDRVIEDIVDFLASVRLPIAEGG